GQFAAHARENSPVSGTCRISDLGTDRTSGCGRRRAVPSSIAGVRQASPFSARAAGYSHAYKKTTCILSSKISPFGPSRLLQESGRGRRSPDWILLQLPDLWSLRLVAVPWPWIVIA